MKLFLAIILFCLSGTSRAQNVVRNVTASCSGINVEFTISPLPTAATGSSYGNGVCAAQCLTGNCISYGVSARITTAGITGTAMSIQNLFGVQDGIGTAPAVPANGASRVFTAVADASNFRKGLVRFVFTVSGATPACNCTADLNIFKAITTSDNINGLTSQCIADGATNIPFIIDPKFSRGIGDGIGVDQYNWVFTSGTWNVGNPSGSGDNSAITRNAPATIPQPCTLQVTQGTACNTVTRNLVIQRAQAAPVITVTNSTGYTSLVANESYTLPSSATNQMTLTVPAGGPYVWSLQTGFTIVSISADTRTLVVNPSGNTSGQISVKVAGGGCNGANSSEDFVEIRRVLAGNILSAPNTCQLANVQFTATIANAPTGNPSNYIWSSTASGTAWIVTPNGSPTGVTAAITPPATNAQPCTVTVTLNGGASIQKIFEVEGTGGRTLTINGPTFPSDGVATYDIVGSSLCWTGGVPACGANNLYYSWTFTGTTFNATAPATLTGCTGVGSRTFEVTRTPLGQPTGTVYSATGTLSVTVRSSFPGCTGCTTPPGPGCLVITSAPKNLTSYNNRPAIGNGGVKDKAVVFSADNLEIFPNPTDGNITIMYNGEVDESKIEIFDPTGKRIKSLRYNGPETKVNVESKIPGIYFLKLINGSKTISKSFLVK